MFRHANDELNYCIYIIPGNPNVTDETLPYWHENIIKNDPNISQALGKHPKMERMKAGKILNSNCALIILFSQRD